MFDKMKNGLNIHATVYNAGVFKEKKNVIKNLYTEY